MRFNNFERYEYRYGEIVHMTTAHECAAAARAAHVLGASEAGYFSSSCAMRFSSAAMVLRVSASSLANC